MRKETNAPLEHTVFGGSHSDSHGVGLTTGRLAHNADLSLDAGSAISDLVARLRFSLRDGRIWLDTERVALVHISTLASMRRGLIGKLGSEEARGVLVRMGYASGTRDAALARKLRPQHNTREAFLVGAQLRLLQGVVSMTPVRLDIDMSTGKFYSEFVWSESFEVDAHIADYGIASEPICWMQLGYACGYSSSFIGRMIVYKEVECRAMGSDVCRIIGKPVDEWDDIESTLSALQPEKFANRFEDRRKTGTALAPPCAPTSQAVHQFQDLIGASSAFNATCHMLKKVADTAATVLFLGETGVGKEIFARTLHRIGKRSDAPFVAVNCAAIPESLIEAELFGVVKGAYTGATQSRAGRFERAHTGTFFLDEVSTLTLSAQGKLLRTLQEGEIERVGDTMTRTVDVRVVAASNEDLAAEVEAGRFREDLYYRLNIFPIRIPPLRERRDDIPLLMDHFLHKYRARHNRNVPGFTERALDALYDYDYPGNIRQLENIIERAVILTEPDSPIDLSHLSSIENMLLDRTLRVDEDGGLLRGEKNGEAGEAPLMEAFFENILGNGKGLESFEEQVLMEAVSRAKGNRSKAARILGITRPQLVYRLKKIGVAE